MASARPAVAAGAVLGCSFGVKASEKNRPSWPSLTHPEIQ